LRSTRRLLLIEHDVLMGAGIRLALLEDGFIVDWVKAGAAAEAALQSDSYSVVVIDVGLPRPQCLAILELLYARRNPVPVVIIGAHENADHLDEIAARIRAALRRQTDAGEREATIFALPFSWR